MRILVYILIIGFLSACSSTNWNDYDDNDVETCVIKGCNNMSDCSPGCVCVYKDCMCYNERTGYWAYEKE